MRFTFAAALAVALFAAGPAAAIDFTTPVLKEDGQPFTRCAEFDAQTNAPAGGSPRCLREEALTLGQLLFDALNAPESGLTNDGIVARGLLALKVRGAKDLELDDRQRDVAKAVLFSAVAKLGYKPVAIVRALELIDPAAVKGK